MKKIQNRLHCHSLGKLRVDCKCAKEPYVDMYTLT